jgi:subtilisin family serine protease/flagellar hook assembly protein FlgD
VAAALLGGLIPIAHAGQLSPGLERQIAGKGGGERIKVLIVLKDQAPIRTIDEDLHAARATFVQRHREVITALRQSASRSQPALLQALEQRRQSGAVLGYSPYWILNAVSVTATIDAIRELAQRSDVDVIEADLQVQLIEPAGDERSIPGMRSIGITPGLVAIEAPRVWDELRVRGTGALVASMDTGVMGTHPALADRWRGNFAAPEHCWRDAAGFGDPAPEDHNSHGTHVMGTICGLAPGDTIGVAPSALWIADNTLNQAGGAEFDNDVASGLQWFADPDRNPATTDDVPDVVEHSWGVHEGISNYIDCDSRWWTAIDNCEAAGVVNVWAAGNDGPAAATIESPADRAVSPLSSFSVGSTQTTPPYTVSGFSSRGPSGCGGPNATKPEVAAPGENIYSADTEGAYRVRSGTSMAGPHVAGTVALMRSANPDLSVDEIKQILLDTTVDLGPAGDDDSYGHGLINAYQAVLAAIQGFGWIEGTVTDVVSGLPIPNALVDLVNDPRVTTADEDGFFRIALPPGSWSLEFSAFGYVTSSRGFEVIADQSTDGDIALSLAPTAVVSGVVQDYLGALVGGATIQVMDHLVPPVTSLSDGTFQLTVPDQVTYVIRARKNGLGSHTQTIPVDGGAVQGFVLPELMGDDFESGDFAMMPWSMPGVSPWTIDTTRKHEGLYSARSGPVAVGQSSSIEADMFLTQGGTASFWLNVSSKVGSDFLRFFVDESLVGSWSGILPWTQFEFPMTQGAHTVRWTYTRASIVAYGEDAAWIDLIDLPGSGSPSFPEITVTPTSLSETLNPNESSNLELLLSNGGQGPLSFTASVQQLSAAFHGVAEESFTRGSGGPDSFGYQWIDSDEADGPVYQWVEIRDIGAAQVMHDNTYTLPKPLGFSFPFYGNVHTSVRISTNGFISFTAPVGTYAANDPIPTASNPNNIVAVFWDDLDADESGTIYTYQDVANSRFIIEWDGVSRNGTNGTQPQTFQTILYSDGRIVTQYKWVSNATGCTVGIENANGTVGLQVAFNQSYLHNELAVLFTNASSVTWLDVAPPVGVIPPQSVDGISVLFNAAGLTAGTYQAFVRIVSNDLDEHIVNIPVTLHVEQGATSADRTSILPTRFALEAPQPNPFDRESSVRFAVPVDGRPVVLSIYDVSGRLVRNLVNGAVPAGHHVVTWDACDESGRRVTSGVYFYRMTAPDFSQVRKVTLLR